MLLVRHLLRLPFKDQHGKDYVCLEGGDHFLLAYGCKFFSSSVASMQCSTSSHKCSSKLVLTYCCRSWSCVQSHPQFLASGATSLPHNTMYCCCNGAYGSIWSTVRIFCALSYHFAYGRPQSLLRA